MKKNILSIFLALIVIFAFAGLTACTENDGEAEYGDGKEEYMDSKIVFTIGETKLSATLVDNEATKALMEKLKESPISIDMNDYGGFEKVGSFGFDLPTSNSQITAQPCEFVLYQGNQLVIFYGSNSWSYTRLGKIEGVTQAELKEILGTGSVTITLSEEVNTIL